MQRTIVVDVVGLTPSLLGEHTPCLNRLVERGTMRPLAPVLPAVTCTVQSTFVTGLPPSGHGCVANGWYFRDLSEVWLWRQSDRLVQGEKVWETARKRDPAFRCAKMFWWYNMYAGVDFSATPRPIYAADGRKLPDIYTQPAGLREELTERLGTFPLFQFWGPGADITSSRWIAEASLHVYRTRRPTLTLIYLPHLDYCLQKLGPRHPDVAREVEAVDRVVGDILDEAGEDGAAVIVLSEYGITPVGGAVHINRVLREAGLLEVRNERGGELLDAGASLAFAVADHQVAHVYVRDEARIDAVAELLRETDGVEAVLGGEDRRRAGLDHPRSGELVCVAEADRWFSYYYWIRDERAPDFARTVEIHRKPGYDPVELFVDPRLRAPRWSIGWRLAKKALGLRSVMDVIPLDASLVRGSHGRIGNDASDGPVCISSEAGLLDGKPRVDATQVKDLILRHVFA